MPPDAKPLLLVASDLSERSDHAFGRAVQLASTMGAGIEVLHVLDDATPETIRAEIRGKSQEALDRIAAATGGVPCTPVLREGHPTDLMIDEIAQRRPALVIVGLHRPRRFFDDMRETTMQRIARLSSAPVLVAVERPEGAYRHILAPTDFSPASTAAIGLAHDLAPEAAIHPIHTIHVPYSGRMARSPGALHELEGAFRNEADASAKAWISDEDLPPQLQPVDVIAGGTLPAILGKVQQADIDLIAVGAHGRVGSMPAFLGSLANDLMRAPPCDLLVARPPKNGD
ncbi:universal stress protein [Aestuariibius sp. 2305UL40-4]|uniref:universal stress protein n=1 Tax=Aestuariibius violaceus TaxID=3234132 RepID=UPI00345E3067